MGTLGTGEDGSDQSVSVVIPTFNRRATLTEVVGAVLNDPCASEVIVVVDGSRDGSFELLERWAESEPRIRPIFQENAGEAIARQKGIEAARGEVIVLLDDDVVAGPGLIGGHARHHVDHKNRLVLGYMPTKVPSQRRSGQVSTILYAEDYEIVCEIYEKDPQSIFRHLWAGNLSLRKNYALEISGSMKDFLPYHEDIDFGIHCRDAGMDPLFDRSLLSSHSHSRNLRQLAKEARRSGTGRANLIERYPERIYHDPLAGFSGLGKVGTRILSSEWVYPVSAPLAMLISLVAGRLGAWKAEVMFARIMRHIEMTSCFRKAQKASRS
jgi:glycosyltransferase involved in cell wall biosynthesis